MAQYTKAQIKKSYTFPFSSGARITGEIGYRSSSGRWHCGIDLCPVKSGDNNVLATCDGTVVFAGWNTKIPAQGNTVIINHDKSFDSYQSAYCHLSAIGTGIKAGEVVKAGRIIGSMGATGVLSDGSSSCQGAHLHYQVMNSQAAYQVKVNDYQKPTNIIHPAMLLWPKDADKWGSKYKSWMIPSGSYAESRYNAGYGGIDNNADSTLDSTLDYNAGGTALLSPSNDERKYGVAVFDTVQALIRGSTAAGVTANNTMGASSAQEALKSYAKYMYYYINSRVSTANIQCLSMPWIRPGFNVWVDPQNIDQVYYVNSVSHQGSPQGGVYTSLGLVFGRDRTKFVDGGAAFGAMRDNSTDNVFINKILVGANTFGPILESKVDFDSVKGRTENYYNQDSPVPRKANEDDLLTYLYGE